MHTHPSAVDEPLNLAFLGDPNSVHMRRWVRYFSDRGHRVTLLVPEGKVVVPGLPPAISVESFLPFSRQRERLFGALESRRSLTRLLRKLAPDVLHAHFVTENAWHAWISGFHPYVVTVWGSDVLGAVRRGRRARFYARVALRAADVVTGGSEHLVRAAVEAGARPQRTRYIHLGVDTERFSPGPDPAGTASPPGTRRQPRAAFEPAHRAALSAVRGRAGIGATSLGRRGRDDLLPRPTGRNGVDPRAGRPPRSRRPAPHRR
jgi:glycosyltransferase involved in cell wall biosynthesis